MIKIITSAEKILVNCKAPFYPYDEKDDFSVSLKKGKNEVEFETDDHFQRFTQATASQIMDGEIDIDDPVDETEEVSAESETKATKGKKK